MRFSPRHRAPRARVARALAVVAEHDVAARRHLLRLDDVVAAPRRLDVGLDQSLAVDVDDAVLHPPRLPGQGDEALDEHTAPAAGALQLDARRRLEHDDVAALRLLDAVDEPVREHAVGEAPALAAALARAVQGRLHRGRRDPVRVDHPRLQREHEPDRGADRDDPVDGDPPRGRQPRGQAVDGIAHLVPHPAIVRAFLAVSAAAMLRPRSRQYARILTLPASLPGGRGQAPETRDHRWTGHYLPARSVRARLCSSRHAAMRAWSPESRTSGTGQPRNSAGRV